MPTKPEAAGKRGEHTPSRTWMQEAPSRNSRGTNIARRERPLLLLVTILSTVETVHGGPEMNNTVVKYCLIKYSENTLKSWFLAAQPSVSSS